MSRPQRFTFLASCRTLFYTLFNRHDWFNYVFSGPAFFRTNIENVKLFLGRIRQSSSQPAHTSSEPTTQLCLVGYPISIRPNRWHQTELDSPNKQIVRQLLHLVLLATNGDPEAGSAEQTLLRFVRACHSLNGYPWRHYSCQHAAEALLRHLT